MPSSPRSRRSGAGWNSTPCSSSISSLANELYTLLLGPVDALVKDKGHLLVAPSGVLTALPFHLLVTEKPATLAPPGRTLTATEDAARYRDAAWLIKRQAVSILPSVSSLQALRSPAQAKAGGKPMIGFGDPVFDPRATPGGQPQTVAVQGPGPGVQRLLARRRDRSQHAHARAAPAPRHRR